MMKGSKNPTSKSQSEKNLRPFFLIGIFRV